jgi:phosphoglycerate kinase
VLEGAFAVESRGEVAPRRLSSASRKLAAANQSRTPMAKKTIDHVDVASKRVLMRVDFNVPLDEQRNITDDRRISEALPSIRSVIDRGGRLVLMSHLGRPEGEGYEEALSLAPVARRLGELLPGTAVHFPGNNCADDKAAEAVNNLQDGEIVLLENLRFDAREQKGEAAFARKLAAFGDIYCNEAFGTAHRHDASMLAVPQAMEGKPRVAGFLLQKELKFLRDAIEPAGGPQKPFVAVLGGAKVSDKLGAIHNLLGKVDTILIGGAMAYTFIKALGFNVGSSLVQLGMVSKAQAALDEANASATDLILPQDHVCGKQITRVTPVQVTRESIPDGWMGLDIGPETIGQYAETLHGAKTIVWNGPMGAFETPPFDVGTRQIADAIAKATEGGAVSVVGGGDTAAAVHNLGLSGRFTHISTGGGASLEMLEGKTFETVELLDDE